MKKNKRLLYVSPFLILGILLVYTWGVILLTDYPATIGHIIGLVLFLLNVALYFLRFNTAIISTGVLLLLASFNLVVFWPEIESTAYGVTIGGVDYLSPGIQWKLFFLFAFYCVVNFDFLVNLYLDYKEKKDGSR